MQRTQQKLTNSVAIAFFFASFLSPRCFHVFFSSFSSVIFGLIGGKKKNLRRRFIANFFHVLPNGFWRIFSMLLSSLPTIKWR